MKNSEGRRLFTALIESAYTRRCIKEATEISDGMISHIKTGRKQPGAAAKEVLQREYNIPLRAWDVPAGTPVAMPDTPRTPAPSRVYEEAPQVGGTLDAIDREIEKLERIRTSDLGVNEYAKLTAEIGRMYDRKEKILSAGRDFERNAVKRSKEWAEVRDLMLRILKEHPDALKAVTAALELHDPTSI